MLYICTNLTEDIWKDTSYQNYACKVFIKTLWKYCYTALCTGDSFWKLWIMKICCWQENVSPQSLVHWCMKNKVHSFLKKTNRNAVHMAFSVWQDIFPPFYNQWDMCVPYISDPSSITAVCLEQRGTLLSPLSVMINVVQTDLLVMHFLISATQIIITELCVSHCCHHSTIDWSQICTGVHCIVPLSLNRFFFSKFKEVRKKLGLFVKMQYPRMNLPFYELSETDIQHCAVNTNNSYINYLSPPRCKSKWKTRKFYCTGHSNIN